MNFTLKIMLDGWVRHTQPYLPERMKETASMLREVLPVFREQGQRVCVYVRDGRILHLIAVE
jgi:hypothetical protein